MLLEIIRNGKNINTFDDAGMVVNSFLANLWAWSNKYDSVKRMTKKDTGTGLIITFSLDEKIEGTKSLLYRYTLPETWGTLDTVKMIYSIKENH